MTEQQLIAAGASLLVGIIGGYRRYQRAGKLKLSRLPWRAFRRLLFELRKTFFSVEKPDGPSFTVDRTLRDIKTTLGDNSYNPAWPLSYHYHGEDYNARMYYFDPERVHPHRQVHVRGFKQDNGGVELVAHEEPAPEHHPKAHLLEREMQDATKWVRDVLNGGRKDAG